MKPCPLLGIPVLLLLSAAPHPAHSQGESYPAKPVRVIVVFPPGGSNDVTARIVFKKADEIAGQQFVIDNRGGAAGTIGATMVAQSPPDGYTVMVQSATHIANAYMYKGKLEYDTLKDFTGVTALAKQIGIMVVHPSMPVKSVKELITLAQRRPGEINYGSAGLGSYVHLNMAMFISMSGTKMEHITYRGGGPLSVGLMSGEVQTTIGTIGSFIRHIQSGRMRALGVTSAQRVPQLPDVPPIGDTLRGFDFTAWVGCFVPARTPKSAVYRLNALLKEALADRDVSSKLVAATLEPMYMTPEQFAQRLNSDYERYGKLMKQIGVVK
ncbi:MAG: Bug family tripartite tricarboxylate transporter substrate binding protein [Betaproteobacteria bacterium]